MTKGWGPDGAPNGWVAVKTVIRHNAINDFATVDARHLLFIFISVEIWIDGELGLGPTTIVSCELSAGHAFFSATWRYTCAYFANVPVDRSTHRFLQDTS